MTRKKYRVAAAFSANLLVFVFAAMAVLPGISSFVLSAKREEAAAVKPQPEPLLAAAESAPAKPEDRVLAVSDTLFSEPETGAIPGSLASQSIDSEKTYAEEAAIRIYLEEREEEQKEAIERETLKYAYSPSYSGKITLQYDSTYEISYRPEEYEYSMLCWVIQHESGPSAFQQGVMVCEAIFNRVKSSRFPNDLVTVLTSPNQFNGLAGFSKAENYQPSETVRSVVAYVLSGKAPDLIDGAVYFCNPDISYHMSWFNTLQMTVEIPHYRFYK